MYTQYNDLSEESYEILNYKKVTKNKQNKTKQKNKFIQIS